MKLLSQKDTVFVIVDMQENLVPYIENKEGVIRKIAKLAKFADIMNIPVIMTEQKNLGLTIPEIRFAAPKAQYVEKDAFGCFDSPEFVKKLGKLKKKTNIVIMGTETHICVLQTALQAPKKYNVHLVVDATSSRKSADAIIAIGRMKSEGIIPTTAETVMFEALRNSANKEFKEVLEVVKA